MSEVANLQSQEHEVNPGPRVPGLHRVEGCFVETVFPGPALTSEVKLGVFSIRKQNKFSLLDGLAFAATSFGQKTFGRRTFGLHGAKIIGRHG